MPSKTGLLLGRMCVYIQLALVARLFSLAILGAVPGLSGSFFSLVPYIILFVYLRNIRIRAQDHDREFFRSKNSKTPDYWQDKWQNRARIDTRTPKDAWRTVLATAIIATGAAFLLIYTQLNFPSPARTIAGDFTVWFYITFLLGPWIGNFNPYQPRTDNQSIFYRRDNPDDDDGLAKVGAPVGPRTPVLFGGNTFPKD